MWRRGRHAAALCAAALAGGLPAGASAQEGGDSCLTTDPAPPAKPPNALRFGITPGTAGSAGAAQGGAAPVDEGRALDALRSLRPRRRELVLRLNRLFWAEGDAAIARFAADVDRHARAGFTSEVQVRYHPPEGAEGDIDAWERFVRAAVRELGRRSAVVAFSITNEANLPASPNTSDGAYEGVVDAIVRGVAAARAELDALGRRDVRVGFGVMWRWSPESDAAFWREVGEKATPAFRAALDHVGLQVYPGLVWPPAPLPGRTAGQEIVEALTLVRDCYMPKAGLGRDVALWVSENGYATNLGRSEASQATDLEATVRDVHRWSGDLGLTDFRYFNLRDNDSDGEDLFDAVGLLRDGYAAKPSAALYRGLVGELGAEWAPSVRMGARRVRGRRVAVRGVAGPAPCAGSVLVRFGRVAVRRVPVAEDCAFAATVRLRRRFGARRLRVSVAYEDATAARSVRWR